jgi:3-deoxy-7-phosphoheptulonate synthase
MIKNDKWIPLPNASSVKQELPLQARLGENINNYRGEIANLLSAHSNRKIIICGPCSIDNIDSALEYAHKLKQLSTCCPNLLLIMRCYFEKGRTHGGWKGLINDPKKNNSFEVSKGLFQCRSTLLKINELNLPIATEFITPHIHHYFSDLVSWGCIGARTIESQPHRELASGLNMPIGFKNSTRGNIEHAINAISNANKEQVIITHNDENNIGIIKTKGNPCPHLVLRGGYWTDNFNQGVIINTKKRLINANQNTGIIVDCSHDNSSKTALKQLQNIKLLTPQLSQTDNIIAGLMIESYLHAGKQKYSGNSIPGISITDECLSWEQTESALKQLNQAL